MTNLRTFHCVPCGSQVESKLLYLSEVHDFWSKIAPVKRITEKRPFRMNAGAPPQIDLPLYIIPAEILAITEDVGVDAALAPRDLPQKTLKVIRRRYQRAMDTLQKQADIWCFKTDAKKTLQWEQTLKSAYEWGTWLIKHEATLQATFIEQGATASSSTSVSDVAPPWRHEHGRRALPKARPTSSPSVSLLPPPPPAPQE